MVGMPTLSLNTRWSQNGVTVAGGNECGSAMNQFCWHYGLDIDDDSQTIVIADYWNHRIVQWGIGEKNGQVVAGGHSPGNKLNQLNGPTDVLIDRVTESLLICDMGNQRVLRWSRRRRTRQGEVLLKDIHCFGLAMDNELCLYVSDNEEHEVRRYLIGDKKGTIVAGGNGQGTSSRQLIIPATFSSMENKIFIYQTITAW